MYSCECYASRGGGAARARVQRFEQRLWTELWDVYTRLSPSHSAPSRASIKAATQLKTGGKKAQIAAFQHAAAAAWRTIAASVRRRVLTEIRPLQARQPAPRAAPAAIPPSHSWVPRTPPSGQALASTIASRASPRTDLVRELLGSPPAHAAKAVAEAAMAEANTTMGDLFGESSGDEEVVAPAAAVPDPPKARRRIIDDDDDDDEDDFAPAPPKPPSPKPDASMSDLFGADSDEDPAEKKDETHKMEDFFGADSDEDKPAESKHRMEDLFGDDDEDEPVAAPVEAPLQRKLHPKKRVLVKGDKVEKLILPQKHLHLRPQQKQQVLRVPKFVAFEQSPWDPDKPQKEYDEGQAVLRWRLEKDILTGESMLDENNKPKWTSNGRLVKWSDGSMQLIVGSERYDIVERPMKSERLCLAGQTQVRGHVSGLAEGARDGDAVEAAFAVVGSA